jgi:hypothetical protein
VATPHEKLAESLRVLQILQERGQRVFSTHALPRVHRERLVGNGFLTEVLKGWYIASRPGDQAGDSTAWYATFYDFIAAYCTSRFGTDWYLSPEGSLLCHAGSTTVPRQVLIHAKDGGNNTITLPFGTSLLDYHARDFAPSTMVVVREGLRLLSLPQALIRATPRFFLSYPLETKIALSLLRDVADIAEPLLEGGHSTIAGRIAGGLRAVGRADEANQLIRAMRVGHTIQEVNPFIEQTPAPLLARSESPYVARLQLLWEAMRSPVISLFPSSPGLPANQEAYLRDITDRHVEDAYHSLSIEGYQVSERLIAKIASGEWSPDSSEQDTHDRNALAAHGYHLAFLSVRESVARIISGWNAGDVARRDHRDWYRLLFEPSVRAGIVEARHLAGYRSAPVFIRNSRHVPPPSGAVRDVMPVLFDLLEHEPEACVRATLGHFFFVYTHPYMDGNGRIGRFLLNAMLSSGGYPWTIIPVERRAEYMAALEEASVGDSIEPFARFIVDCMRH